MKARRGFIMLLACVFLFAGNASPAEDSLLEPYIDVDSIIAGTSYQDIPEAMKIHFHEIKKVHDEFRGRFGQAEQVIHAAYENRLLMEETLGPMRLWNYELRYIFSMLSRAYTFDFDDEDKGPPPVLPQEGDMTEAQAIALAWEQIMDEYGETEERIHDFNIGSIFYQTFRNGELTKTEWKFQFYLKDATDFVQVGYYTVWVNIHTGEVVAMNDGTN